MHYSQLKSIFCFILGVAQVTHCLKQVFLDWLAIANRRFEQEVSGCAVFTKISRQYDIMNGREKTLCETDCLEECLHVVSVYI